MNKESLLGISWHDSAWIPILNPGNVLDYFSERTNVFYDRTCNNEIVKMQRLSPDQLMNMTGLEYILLHVQEPVLYVIRKQHRHSPTHATPLADYYIIAGRVYQAPDLGSVVNARMLNTVNHLQSAFEECLSYTRYHPSKGYWWEFRDKESSSDDKYKKADKQKEETSSAFQRQRVDMLLSEIAKKFPLPLRAVQHHLPPSQIQQQQQQQIQSDNINKANSTTSNSGDDAVTVKIEAKENDASSKQLSTTNQDSSNTTTSSTTTTTSSTTSSSQGPGGRSMKAPPEKKPRLN